MEPLNFTLPPASLEQLSAAQTSIDILRLGLVTKSIVLSNRKLVTLDTADTTWLRNHVRTLELPTSTRKYLNDYVLYVFNEFKRWYLTLCGHVRLNPQPTPSASSFFPHVVWTGRAEIDECMTAHNIIMKTNFDNASKYRLACQYYMEGCVHMLYRLLEPGQFHNFDKRLITIIEDFNVVFWTYEINNISGEITNLIQEDLENTSSSELEENPEYSVYARVLLRALNNSEIHAVRYLSGRCAHFENRKVLSYLDIKIDTNRDITLFYYSFMNRLDQERDISRVSLSFLFYSISPDLFVRTFQDLLPLIDDDLELYSDILCAITRHLDKVISKPFPPTTFKLWSDIIDALWLLVPQHFRTYVLSQRDPGDVGLLIERLHKWGHEISVDNIITYADPEQRFQICKVLVRQTKYALKYGEYNDDYSLRVLNDYAHRFFADGKIFGHFDKLRKKVPQRMAELQDWKNFIAKAERLWNRKRKSSEDINPKASPKKPNEGSASNLVAEDADNTDSSSSLDDIIRAIDSLSTESEETDTTD